MTNLERWAGPLERRQIDGLHLNMEYTMTNLEREKRQLIEKMTTKPDIYAMYNQLLDINSELLEALKQAAEVLANQGRADTVGLEMFIEQAIKKAEGR